MLLYGEQGFGDTIQFSRYVPLVAKRGARVVLQVQDALTELMASLVGTSEVLALGSQVPDFQLQCPVGSLPLAFETTIETIPPPALLQPSQNALLHWEMRLGPKLRPRIGLVWSGRPTHLNDANRSIALASLLPLLDLEATFVSLQKDVGIEDSAALRQRRDLVHFGEELKNFSDTAALISHLDLVVSVDTSVAHLAGAIGKPVWILLPHTPDFRWLLDRTDSPWYPTARLFRQDCKRTWQEVIARVRTELVGFVEKMRQAN
jgi:hypothetical protein